MNSDMDQHDQSLIAKKQSFKNLFNTQQTCHTGGDSNAKIKYLNNNQRAEMELKIGRQWDGDSNGNSDGNSDSNGNHTVTATPTSNIANGNSHGNSGSKHQDDNTELKTTGT